MGVEVTKPEGITLHVDKVERGVGVEVQLKAALARTTKTRCRRALRPCWSATRVNTLSWEMVSPSGLSHNEIADRLSSTSEYLQTQSRAPNPDSASAAAKLSKRHEG